MSLVGRQLLRPNHARSPVASKTSKGVHVRIMHPDSGSRIGLACG